LLYFAEKITIPILKEGNKYSILEIGSSYGNSIRPILELENVKVTIIDPCLDADLLDVFGDRITLHKELSLIALPRLKESYDCIFIDGDHNWYTVLNELKIIEDQNLLKTDGIIFLHDAGWPYGRRDMYYQPDVIPSKFRKKYSRDGIKKGQSLLVEDGGFNVGHFNATEEHGVQNGVLTAAEDYLKQSKLEYYLVVDFREFGLAVLIRKSKNNNWKFASNLRLKIFRQIHIDPYSFKIKNTIYKFKTSSFGAMLRNIRNSIIRKRA